MTAITPLESIHKKGIFGDHQKKEAKDLLKISEIKGLTIVQVVKYKKKNVDLKNIKIDDLTFPINNSEVTSNKKTRILWNAPRTWLVISFKEEIINMIKERCNNEDFAITDISHSRASIQIQGLNAREVLKKGCPLNINDFKKNNCAGSVYHGITIMIDCIETNQIFLTFLFFEVLGSLFIITLQMLL